MNRKIKDVIIETDNKIEEINNQAKAAVDEAKRSALESTVNLFSEIGWGNWSEPQLKNEEQFSRLKKSISDKMKLVNIDRIGKSGLVLGSAMYEVNGKGCTCTDFATRRMPCKHMYFLALNLANDDSEQYVQLELQDVASEKSQTSELVLETGILGCCSKFRDCSIAGHCLQTDEYYKQCGYRKNLERGNIFYTEKSHNFSRERYDYIESFRNSLDEGKKSAFDEIVIYFEKTKRGTKTCFCLSSPMIKDIVSKCNVFNIIPVWELVKRVFDASLISNTRAAELHNKYSKLPIPNLLPPPPPLPQTATNTEKSERDKLVKRTNAENLKIWENHYCSDLELQKILLDKFLYFEVTEYSFELNEFFANNLGIIKMQSSELVYFDSKNPIVFREKLV